MVSCLDFDWNTDLLWSHLHHFQSDHRNFLRQENFCSLRGNSSLVFLAIRCNEPDWVKSARIVIKAMIGVDPNPRPPFNGLVD